MAGCAVWVDPGWWDPPGQAVADGYLPAVALEVSMVGFAKQREIVEIGRAAVSPRHDVMALGPLGWPVTVGEAAALVARDQGQALAPCGDAFRAAFSKHGSVSVTDE